jgi:hypothetical protein
MRIANRIFRPQLPMANQIPFLPPAFQQFGEKECGKELSCVRKPAYAARFIALHWIMCGC